MSIERTSETEVRTGRPILCIIWAEWTGINVFDVLLQTGNLLMQFVYVARSLFQPGVFLSRLLGG
jgi:hypothetical protein